MEQSKPYDNLSVEELIALAEKDQSNERLTDVETFIMEVQMKVGPDKVDGLQIYWRYCKWCKERKTLPLTRKKFYREIKPKYKSCQSKGSHCFLVDAAPFEISTEEWFQMRKAFRNERQKSKKQKAKIASKKSRLKSEL